MRALRHPLAVAVAFAPGATASPFDTDEDARLTDGLTPLLLDPIGTSATRRERSGRDRTSARASRRDERERRRAPVGNTTVACALVVGLLAMTDAAAFDGKRKGFLVGLGLGAQSSHGTISEPNGFEHLNRSESDDGTALSLRIGGGLSERSTLYLARQANIASNDTVYGLTGLGGARYFGESGRTVYLHGGIGIGDIVPDGGDTVTGGAAMLGVGVELIRGLHLELTVMGIAAEEPYFVPASGASFDVDYAVSVTQFTVGYTWF